MNAVGERTEEELRKLAGTIRREDCPLVKKHTKAPDGYVQRALWAERRAKTHRQVRCQGCGLFAIWVKR